MGRSEADVRSRSSSLWAKLAVSVVALAVSGGLGAYAVRHPGVKRWVKITFANPMAQDATELDRRIAYEYFGAEKLQGPLYYDPEAYLLHKPDVDMAWDWPEHASGEIVMRTNAQGFRNDAPVRDDPALRILVAGDSHTAGVVPNEECFAHLVERGLAADMEGVEVLNAGVPYTGPSCYLGVLRRNLELKPDLFVAVLFTGNDFADELRLRYVLDGWSLPKPEGDYLERLRTGAAAYPDCLYQGFNQAIRWKAFPAEMERALELVIEAYRRMQELCDEHGVTFLAVVLPTKVDVDGDDLEVQRRIREILGLSEEEARVNRELGRRFAAALEEAGIECLDPSGPMREHTTPLYWSQDYHLSTAGNALLAEQILARIRAGAFLHSR